MSAADRRTRAEARRGRAILSKGRVTQVEKDLCPIRGAEALSLVHRLTQEGWSLAGYAQPSYTRDEIPCRFVPRRPR